MHNCSNMTAGSVCNSQFFHQFFISCCHSNAIYFRSNTVATDFFNFCDTTSVNIFSIGFLQTLADRMRRGTLCKGCIFQKFCIFQLIMVYSAYFKHTLCHGTGFSDKLKKACFVDDIEGLDESPLACAYARARGTDRMCSFGDWVALSDVCDVKTAELIKREVSDGIIAPGYEPEALEILKSKRKGSYNIVEIDPDYIPEEIERKQVYGITFEQGRNNFKIDEALLSNVVTENKNIPESAKRDLIISLITLKYTQSNSVCYAYDGQAIGVGAGQQSRVHCTRLAGSKADTWFLRQCDKVLSLPFRDDIKRPDRDNIIDGYINRNEEDVCADGVWQKYFIERPAPLTDEDIREYLSGISGVSLGSDAFFPFSDNIERARKSGVTYIAEPGGSIRDDLVIDCCNKYGMAMAFTGMRLFHH